MLSAPAGPVPQPRLRFDLEVPDWPLGWGLGLGLGVGHTPRVSGFLWRTGTESGGTEWPGKVAFGVFETWNLCPLSLPVCPAASGGGPLPSAAGTQGFPRQDHGLPLLLKSSFFFLLLLPFFFFLMEVKFTQHKINFSKVCPSVAFSIFIMLYNHHLCLALFIAPKETSHPLSRHSAPPTFPHGPW